MAIQKMVLAGQAELPLPDFKKGVPPLGFPEVLYILPKCEKDAYKHFGFHSHKQLFNWATSQPPSYQQIDPRKLIATQDEVDESTVKEIAEALLKNKKLRADAIRVAYDVKNYYVVDGHHRLAAHLAVGRTKISIELVTLQEDHMANKTPPKRKGK